MAVRYAKDQPSGFTNRIERVTIVGAGGMQGRYITAELLKTGKNTITALTRPDSTTKIPDGLHHVTKVDFDDEASLVKALQGQQFLVITMSVLAPPETESKLIQAAAKAGVPYVMPNCYGLDVYNDGLVEDIASSKVVRDRCNEIEVAGSSSWIALVCGLWYEYSLISGHEWYGFDFKEKKITFYDDGNTKINTTTWEQCGRAVAALCALKELPDDENDKSPSVSAWKNKPVHVSSFLISQKDMFESWKRVTGETDADWTIDFEGSAERRKRGLDIFEKTGDRRAWGLSSFCRVFYPNGDGDYESKYGLDNGKLGLPKENLDERTKVAKRMIDAGFAYFGDRSF
ncbi:hypothetical protein MMC25_000566 [Agyrium rufum]|nr:hypothetical protein [Agyrium rufum]